ncbi:FAD binding domain-containing protein [Xylaria sp. CBS 124048]|nr:FAD binding domain-containing protein [Xylaria sp. CBS 124048]
MSEDEHRVDVLVVGAGPVGLLTAYQLAKFGGLSVRIIEKTIKSGNDTYGRAITLFPRTTEMLDQLGLADEILQQAFACRETVAYNAKGEEVQGRAWSFINSMKDTAFDFALVLRQQYYEEIFRNALDRYGVEVEAPIELVGVDVDKRFPPNRYPVTATVRDTQTKVDMTIRCRCLIGADGGHSSVRRILAIPFEGSTSEDKWVRIDGHVQTNLPKPRTYCSIESPTHGNVLWVGLDRGATRIGYAFTDDRANAYPKFDQQAAMKEAIAAVKPFTLQFERVDWWTIYTVGQRIAKQFSVEGCVFLVGDACHTHSSGAAQGMNTGIHDAINLAWKLSWVLRGFAFPAFLSTYEIERRPNVQKLIQYDADISCLMTNRLPENWPGDPTADVNEVLAKVMEEAGAFSSGLGISYEPQLGNALVGADRLFSYAGPLKPGLRAPDIPLSKPGTFERTRLLRETPNQASFYVIFFAAECTPGIPECVLQGVTQSRLLQTMIENRLMLYLTILPTQAPLVCEALGHEPLGRAYFDLKCKTGYARYGVDSHRGGIFVIRPDGWINAMLPLDIDVASELEALFVRMFPNLILKCRLPFP